jgi:hypothetical protein
MAKIEKVKEVWEPYVTLTLSIDEAIAWVQLYAQLKCSTTESILDQKQIDVMHKYWSELDNTLRNDGHR